MCIILLVDLVNTVEAIENQGYPSPDKVPICNVFIFSSS